MFKLGFLQQHLRYGVAPMSIFVLKFCGFFMMSNLYTFPKTIFFDILATDNSRSGKNFSIHRSHFSPLIDLTPKIKFDWLIFFARLIAWLHRFFIRITFFWSFWILIWLTLLYSYRSKYLSEMIYFCNINAVKFYVGNFRCK